MTAAAARRWRIADLAYLVTRDRHWHFGPPSDVTDMDHSVSVHASVDVLQFGLSAAWDSTTDDRNAQLRVGPLFVQVVLPPTRRARRLNIQDSPLRMVRRKRRHPGGVDYWTAYWDWRHVGASTAARWFHSGALAHVRVGPVGLVWERDRAPRR